MQGPIIDLPDLQMKEELYAPGVSRVIFLCKVAEHCYQRVSGDGPRRGSLDASYSSSSILNVNATMRAIRSGIGLVGLLGMFLPTMSRGEEVQRYRGFGIDDSRVRRMANLDKIWTATKEQIDIVCAVGVPEEMLTFFQSVPFEVVPPGVIAPGNPGLYSAKTKTVQVTAVIVIAGHKPVLLHELLHAYHDQRIPDGFNNAAIARFYARAQAISAYAPKSHMMLNDREFFACAGSAYLFGVTAQEPFRREKIKDNQPIFYGYLKTLFGPTSGEYHGSLREPN